MWVKLLIGLLVLGALIALLLTLFPWDLLRRPLNRYVTEKTGRHFEITRKLDVKLGRTMGILADGIEMANPEWPQDPLLVKAESAEIDVLLLPLLRRRLEFPLIVLRQPQLSLQIEADGGAAGRWAATRPTRATCRRSANWWWTRAVHTSWCPSTAPTSGWTSRSRGR